jgi:hypothetical protein
VMHHRKISDFRFQISDLACNDESRLRRAASSI